MQLVRVVVGAALLPRVESAAGLQLEQLRVRRGRRPGSCLGRLGRGRGLQRRDAFGQEPARAAQLTSPVRKLRAIAHGVRTETDVPRQKPA